MTKSTHRIFLIGLMGSGKTTIGKIVAKKLHFTFMDSDVLIEEKTGVKVPLIFEYEGEEGFRKREASCLIELVTKNDMVLATGGGMVCYQETTGNCWRSLEVSFTSRRIPTNWQGDWLTINRGLYCNMWM